MRLSQAEEIDRPIDLQIAADLAAGRLDKLIQEALDDNNGRTQPL